MAKPRRVPETHGANQALIPASTGQVREVVTGRITELAAGGVAAFEWDGLPAPVPCRVAGHIGAGWLRAALERGPVAAEAAVAPDRSSGSVWAVFPGPEHEGVLPDELELAAAKAVRVVCGQSKVVLQDDEMRLRSRNSSLVGTQAIYIIGGTVKVN